MSPAATASTGTGLYSTDNFRILCTEHLGTQARYTGRDLSGLRIRELTEQELTLMRRDLGELEHLVGCETCRAIARTKETS